MRFPTSWFSKRQNIFTTVDERTIRQAANLSTYLGGESLQVKAVERLFQWQSRLSQHCLDAIRSPCLAFTVRQFQKVKFIAERFLFGLLGERLIVFTKRWEPKLP